MSKQNYSFVIHQFIDNRLFLIFRIHRNKTLAIHLLRWKHHTLEIVGNSHKLLVTFDDSLMNANQKQFDSTATNGFQSFKIHRVRSNKFVREYSTIFY